MLRKFKGRLVSLPTNVINKTFKKKKRRRRIPSPSPSPSFSPSPKKSHSPPSTSATMQPSTSTPFLFPAIDSPIIPSPSPFFSPHLLGSPLPTNSFFQNFTLNGGDQPEYIHPYLIKSSSSSLTLCYPQRFHSPLFLYQTFVPDLTISTSSHEFRSSPTHSISAFDDLSVTLDVPPGLCFFLVRGSPYVTCSTKCPTHISLRSVHAFLSVTPDFSHTKHTFRFNSGQTFLCYSSSPLHLEPRGTTELASPSTFSGVLRFAALLDPSHEPVLDHFSACYPTSGTADLAGPNRVDYRWETKGWGDLLLLAHPLHLRLLDLTTTITIHRELTYNSIDGELVGVVGNLWTLAADPIPITWHSVGGVCELGREEIVSALHNDVGSLSSSPITTTSSYLYGKAVARAARLALIAEEVGCLGLIPVAVDYLKDTVTAWLDGSFEGNGFLYDPKWRGIVTQQGAADRGADFGFGIYNDHHYHIGYFLYAIAVLCKLEPAWGRTYRPQAYALLADILTLSRRADAKYTRLRCFDLWKLHSWAGGLTEFADGRNQESTSEAVNAYYAAALMGLSYGDTRLVAAGSMLAALEVRAAETWWHVREGGGMYGEEFERENRVVGVLWNNKRDGGLWFAPAEWRECRLGIQVLPLLPVTEVLFGDVGFVRQLVEWAQVALRRDGVGDGWKGFLYALEGVYDKESALGKVRRELHGFDDGNSLSNLLWWLHSRRSTRWSCWFARYCH